MVESLTSVLIENQLSPLLWRHNDRGGVSDHQPYDFLLNRLFKWR